LAKSRTGTVAFPRVLRNLARTVGRATVPSLAALVAAPASAADPLTAEEAIAHQEAELERALGLRCGPDGEEIVVCGRPGPDPNRIQSERLPGERVSLPPNEVASARDALAIDTSPCTTVGPNQRCSGGLDVFRVVAVLARIGKHVLDPED
jgi:hypothetical protein